MTGPSLVLARTVSGGYASDMLSDVLANAPWGGVLVTIQVHMNVIAVSVNAGLAAVAQVPAAAAFLALGHTFRRGELVRMTLALDRLAPPGDCLECGFQLRQGILLAVHGLVLQG